MLPDWPYGRWENAYCSSVNFTWIVVSISTVLERGLIAPLADGFDGGARKIGIHLAIQQLQRERSAVLTHNRMKQHGTLGGRDERGSGKAAGY